MSFENPSQSLPRPTDVCNPSQRITWAPKKHKATKSRLPPPSFAQERNVQRPKLLKKVAVRTALQQHRRQQLRTRTPAERRQQLEEEARQSRATKVKQWFKTLNEALRNMDIDATDADAQNPTGVDDDENRDALEVFSFEYDDTAYDFLNLDSLAEGLEALDDHDDDDADEPMPAAKRVLTFQELLEESD